MYKDKHILVAPLNWGLGHATRCMPIIDRLLELDAQVTIGGEGRSLELLKKEYPAIPAIQLPSYDVTYPEDGRFVAHTLKRVPEYLKAVRDERLFLQKITRTYGFDAVISDNRYGLYGEIPSVFICHQLAVILPGYFSLLRNAVYKLHLQYMKGFQRIWIPDSPGNANLSGDLTHRYALPEKALFIGSQSRFAGMTGNGTTDHEKPGLLAVLSGPEPQRTLLEEKLVEQANRYEISMVIVQGKPECEQEEFRGCAKMVSFQNKVDLFHSLKAADVVISRSGYSTVMDLSCLRKKAIFIPTPGQTEQTYLAENLQKQGVAPYYEQGSFDLRTAMLEQDNYKGFRPSPSDGTLLDSALADLRTLLAGPTDSLL